MPRSSYPRKKYPVPIVQVDPWAPGSVWTGTDHLVPPPGFDPKTVRPVASRYSDYAIPAPFYTLYKTSNKCLVKYDFELLSYYFGGAIMICFAQYFGVYSNYGNCTQTRVKYGGTSCARMPFWWRELRIKYSRYA